MTGMPHNPQVANLTRWLRKASGGLGDETGGLDLHMRGGASRKASRIRQFTLAPETNLEVLAAEIIGASHEEALGTGNGTHSFIVYAIRATDKDGEYFDSHRFMISTEGGPDADDADGAEKTLLAQMQRHNEALVKMLVQHSANIAGAQAQMQSEQAQIMETLMRQNQEYAKMDLERSRALLESTRAQAVAVNEAADRTLDREIKKQMYDGLFTFGAPIAGAIAQRMLGVQQAEEKDATPSAPKQISAKAEPVALPAPAPEPPVTFAPVQVDPASLPPVGVDPASLAPLEPEVLPPLDPEPKKTKRARRKKTP